MNKHEATLTITEILNYSSKKFDRIADDLISQIPLKDHPGIFGYQQAIVERIQDFLSRYPDLITKTSNEIIEEFDNKNHEHEILKLREGLISLGREKIEHYVQEYFNKPLKD